MKEKNKTKFIMPLCELDTPTQTYGCRASHHDACRNAYIPGQCAFASQDGICHRPLKNWAKQYAELSAEH